jgi:hypothetical protein
MRGLFQFGFQTTVRNKKTQADAATILMYGPDISRATGMLADQNEWVAKAIDMMTDTTENAAAALMMAAIPFALQIARNHEPTADVETVRGIKIPFTKRTINVRFHYKLRRTRKFTYPPDEVKAYVFSNEMVKAKLEKQGIKLV